MSSPTSVPYRLTASYINPPTVAPKSFHYPNPSIIMAHGYALDDCPANLNFKHSLIADRPECPLCRLRNGAFTPPSNASRAKTPQPPPQP